MTYFSTFLPTPIGQLGLLVDGEERLVRIDLPRDRTAPAFVRRIAAQGGDIREDRRATRRVAEQLRAYFAGERQSFDLELRPVGSSFQRLVWDELVKIPFGETRSYSDVATAIGHPAACRAVGAANGANPIPIVIPCHRVIGADGSLTGYGGGLPSKRFLLELEGVVPRSPRQLGLLD